ncbi:MFS transporter [Megasphaera vaginalis (ex Bordigoni et al. 2020)]|uniref:MFS transporter n=1 Tax=Megasphaera vaginalis (ex Bordigoni et al. 2020) TaxID=2045301 RepID=UPI000C7B5D5E|nr:MFS transporter [Megasphaera vaginalis (ex Bordigoni et al. 2020)]
MSDEKRVSLAIYITAFIGSYLSTAINIAIPAISSEFSAPADTLGWVVTSFLIASAAFLLPFGKLADLKGRRKTYTVSLAVFALSTLTAAASFSIEWLIICRIVQGAALAATYVTYMPILLAVTDEAHYGRRLGIAVSLTYLGLSCGPVAGGFLTQFSGWRSIFILAFAFQLSSLFLLFPVRAEWYSRTVPYVNFPGSVLAVTSITFFLYGLSHISESYVPCGAGILLLALFILHEKRCAYPLLPLFLFRNLTFTMSNAAALIQYSATYGISFLLSLYLQLVLQLTPLSSGLILLIQPLLMAALSTKAGDLADRYGPRLIASIGIAVTTAGLSAFAFTAAPTVAMTAANLILIGIGAALFGAPNNSAIMGAVPVDHRGTASGVLALVRNCGQAMSMAIVTFIFHATAGTAAYGVAVAATVRSSFLIFTGLCALAVFASLCRGKKSPRAD